MAYSHSRLRKTLALVRIMTGAVFLSLGAFKVSSLEFGKFIFPDFLDAAARTGAPAWFRPLINAILNYGPARVGVFFGFVELSIGVALVLGLAVRPACLLGFLYSAWIMLATWNPVEGSASMLQTTDHQFRALFPLMVFALLGVGHAGETWGVGSLYHRRRAKAWGDETPRPEPRPPVAAEEYVFYGEETGNTAEREIVEAEDAETVDRNAGF